MRLHLPHRPKTHDYRRGHRCWGHDITYRPTANNGLRASGWGHGIRAGDWVLLSNPDTGDETRYRFDHISYFADPHDMWSADLSFAPRR